MGIPGGRRFSLIEIIAVIAVIAMVMTIASVSLRSSSGSMTLTNALGEFKSFCAQVRSQAISTGRDRVIYFRAEDRTFHAGDPIEDEEETFYTDWAAEELEAPALSTLEWVVPADFTLNEERFLLREQNGDLEVFRFFPDGAASGKSEFRMEYRGRSGTAKISPLTGVVVVSEGG